MNAEKKILTTWACSQYLTEEFNLPSVPLFNNSIRQIIRTSIGANKTEKIRIKLSNKCGDVPLQINGASIAISDSQGSGKIKINTTKKITFNNKDSISIPAGEEIYSDFFDFYFEPLTELSITLFYGPRCFSTDKKEEEQKLLITGHPGSRTNTFFEEGNALEKEQFSSENKVAHWYTIAAIEIMTDKERNVIVCFGDSITDGRGSTDDKQDRWTDHLATLGKGNFAVINQGIGGTCVGYHGIRRFQDDVLNQKGISHIIMLYGINDIIYMNSKADVVIDVYKKLIIKARKNNLKIYGCTILPFGNFGDYTEEKNSIREEVNYWIRNTSASQGGFDEIIDFEKLTADKNNNTLLAAPFDCSDGLHPSANGYKQMATAFNDLTIFL